MIASAQCTRMRTRAGIVYSFCDTDGTFSATSPTVILGPNYGGRDGHLRFRHVLSDSFSVKRFVFC